MNEKSAIIFDMDGTLIDSETVFQTIAIEAFAEFDTTLETETYAKWKGMPTKKIEAAILNKFGADFPVAKFRKRFSSKWRGYVDNYGISLMPGIKELYEELIFAKIRISVATSTQHDKAIYHLKLAGLNIPAHSVIGGDMVKKGKPFPDIFIKAANCMQCSPHQCIVVEDSVIGIIGAKAAGMTTIFVPNSKTIDTKKKWDYLASSPNERNQIIKQLLKL